jgi:DNA polymerase-1
MIDCYIRGDDLHAKTAQAISGQTKISPDQRRAAKAVNFGNLYGQGAQGLAKTARLSYGANMTPEQARAALNAFSNAYPELDRWKRQQFNQAQRTSQVTTRLGLVRDFDVQAAGYLRGEAQNIPVQGSAAEVMICTLSRLPDALKQIDAHLSHHIHDELLIDVAEGDADKAEAILVNTMKEGFLDVFPEGEALLAGLVEVKTGKNWSEVH